MCEFLWLNALFFLIVDKLCELKLLISYMSSFLWIWSFCRLHRFSRAILMTTHLNNKCYCIQLWHSTFDLTLNDGTWWLLWELKSLDVHSVRIFIIPNQFWYLIILTVNMWKMYTARHCFFLQWIYISFISYCEYFLSHKVLFNEMRTLVVGPEYSGCALQPD